MLKETASLAPTPRSRRSSPPGVAPGGILFGIASPILPALEHQWPSWLAPIGSGWKPAHARSAGSNRRSL